MANWFVGLPIAPGDWYALLIADAPAAVRPFHPEDLHATVAFLGACGPERASAAWETAGDFAAAAVEATLGSVEPFGDPRRPSALSVTLAAGLEQAAAVIGALRGPMWTAAGARIDRRPPLPHVTIARPVGHATAAQRARAIAWAKGKGPIGARVRIDRVALYTWNEDRRARQFRIVSERSFG